MLTELPKSTKDCIATVLKALALMDRCSVWSLTHQSCAVTMLSTFYNRIAFIVWNLCQLKLEPHPKWDLESIWDLSQNRSP